MASKLDEVLDEQLHKANNRGLTDIGDVRSIKNESKQQIKDLFLEIVGKDEDFVKGPDGFRYGEPPESAKATLRAELRRKIEEL